jgi:hypothetical protein
MDSFLVSTVVLIAGWAATAADEGPASLYETSADLTPGCKIDELVFARLKELGVEPAYICSDGVFVRRAYLDVIGTLPTAEEAKEFIEDPDENKRRALIDRLLERSEFADYWAMKWGDVLRIKAEFPVNLWPNAAQAYHRWVRASIATNKPYDQFAREMLTSSGSNFRVGPVNFYRAVQNRTPESLAIAVALTFMGSRAESWSEDRLAGMTVFFSQIGYKPTSEWKEEVVFWDPLNTSEVPGNSVPGTAKPGISALAAPDEPEASSAPATGEAPRTAVLPDGTTVSLPPDKDPREVFADWLITAENPWFARSIVNRVWAWLLGRGIVHEADDIRDDNPPSNPELLAYLEKELVTSDYDLKRLYRMILNSKTYQLSSVPRFNQPEAAANFASYPLRRLEAEVLIDAVNKITGTTDLYTSPIPEPYTYIPHDMPAIAVADGSITSPFLALFGRSARATGMASERVNKLGRSQWLHMLNSGHIQQKLTAGPKLRAMLLSGGKPEALVQQLYLTILSRQATAEEVKTALAYGQPAAAAKSQRRPPAMNARDRWTDLTWALINSTEFLYRH